MIRVGNLFKNIFLIVTLVPLMLAASPTHTQPVDLGEIWPVVEIAAFSHGALVKKPGSGSIIDPDQGFILTNSHVIRDGGGGCGERVQGDVAQKLFILVTIEGLEYKSPIPMFTAIPIDDNPDLDLALIRIDKLLDEPDIVNLDDLERAVAARELNTQDTDLAGLKCIDLANSEQARIKNQVGVAGYPIPPGYPQELPTLLFTEGIVSGFREEGRIMLIDARATYGNSGGAVADGDDRLIGVLCGAEQIFQAGPFIARALPINLACELIKTYLGQDCPPPPIGQPPQASFTFSPQQPFVGEAVSFDATGSLDPDGRIDKYEWDFGDGRIVINKHDNPEDPDPKPTEQHAFEHPEIFEVKLAVTDNSGLSDSIAQEIQVMEVPNQPPIADFSFSPSEPTAQDAIQFIDMSSDSDGTIVSRDWDFGDGSSSTNQNPVHKYADDGAYTVSLTVTDDDGVTDTTSKAIVVANAGPIATFSFLPTHPQVGDEVTFDASASADPDGIIVQYEWDFGDASSQTASTPVVQHTYDNVGRVIVKLTITDDDGAHNSAIQSIKVRQQGMPVAQYTFTPPEPRIGEPVTFDASDSYDPDGFIVKYEWDLDDGSLAMGRIVTHVYSAPGIYEVRLAVTDNDNNIDTETKKLVPLSPPPPPRAVKLESGVPSTRTCRAAEEEGYGVLCTTQFSIDVAAGAGGLNIEVEDSGEFTLMVRFGNPIEIAEGRVIYDYGARSRQGRASITIDTSSDPPLRPGTYYTAIGNFESLEQEFTVTAATAYNLRPLASFTFFPSEPKVGQVVYLDASASYDPDGRIVSYEWDFGDGTVEATSFLTVEHIYWIPGRYMVTLAVVDEMGAISTISRAIMVLPSLFYDDFGDPRSGWPVRSDPMVEEGYKNGEYSIMVKVPNLITWSLAPTEQSFGNFALEVDTRQVSEATGEYGVIFRFQDEDNSYAFSINSNGLYRLDKRLNGEWISLIPWTNSPLIDPTGWNQLKVEAVGTKITLYINDQPLATVTDSSFTEGNIGLFVGTFEEPNVEVHFDNVVVSAE